jgi:protein tyrosine/serine phosphatase
MRVSGLARQRVFAKLQVFLAVIFSLSISAAVSAKSAGEFSNIHIKNFGQMDDRFYRGAQPSPEDYKALADLGIKTIIDLQDDPVGYEKNAAEALGMHYVHIAMSDSHLPSDAQIDQFLKIASDPHT